MSHTPSAREGAGPPQQQQGHRAHGPFTGSPNDGSTTGSRPSSVGDDDSSPSDSRLSSASFSAVASARRCAAHVVQGQPSECEISRSSLLRRGSPISVPLGSRSPPVGCLSPTG
eukprot:8889268-Heterocapsa_arctica.AAC.1